jgi:hypothetical protein
MSGGMPPYNCFISISRSREISCKGACHGHVWACKTFTCSWYRCTRRVGGACKGVGRVSEGREGRD